MLKAFEQRVSDTLDALEDEGLVNPHEDTEDYDELADLVRERIGNFHEWKARSVAAWRGRSRQRTRD